MLTLGTATSEVVAFLANACHMGGTRLDWKALGYKGDPMTAGARKVSGATRR